MLRAAMRQRGPRREERDGKEQCRQGGETPHRRHSMYAWLRMKTFTALLVCLLVRPLAVGLSHGQAAGLLWFP
jgi:hypothetical protein